MLHFFLAHHRLALAASMAAATATTGQLQALDASDILIFSRDPVILRPQLEMTEAYNDNIFFKSDDQVGDIVSTISPGLNVQLGKLEGNFLSADYMFDNVFYADNSEQNAQQHRLAFRNKYEFKRLTVEGNDGIAFLSSVLGGGFSLGGVKVDRTMFNDAYTLRYAVSPKTGVYLRGSHDAVDYQEGIGLSDANTLIGTGGFSYQAFPKTSAFGELYYGQTGTDPNDPVTIKPPHAEFIGGFLGVSGSFTEKLSGSVKAGYEMREFSDRTPAPSLPVVEASVTQRFSEKTSLALSYSRRGYVSVQFLKQSYTADMINLSLVQWVGTSGKLRATLGGAYDLYQYEKVGAFAERKDDSYTAYLNLNYDLRLWLKANLGYHFESFRSDLPGVIDYDVNRVTLGLAIGY
ncbi:MAG: outer membrane beta-barrel protein [Verrucomicrobiota bacterium]